MRTWLDHTITWWDALVRPENAGQLVLEREKRPGFNSFLAAAITALYMLYGVSMGLFRGYYPAAVSGIKLPFIYLFTLGICFPAFYTLNCLYGPRLTARQVEQIETELSR